MLHESREKTEDSNSGEHTNTGHSEDAEKRQFSAKVFQLYSWNEDAGTDIVKALLAAAKIAVFNIKNLITHPCCCALIFREPILLNYLKFGKDFKSAGKV